MLFDILLRSVFLEGEKKVAIFEVVKLLNSMSVDEQEKALLDVHSRGGKEVRRYQTEATEPPKGPHGGNQHVHGWLVVFQVKQPKASTPTPAEPMH
jgi:hypothetical protein